MTEITNNPRVNKLSDRLSNHVDANCDAIAYFVEQHPDDLGREEREKFARTLQLNANKLMDLAQRLNGR
jgi:hypothetical protein